MSVLPLESPQLTEDSCADGPQCLQEIQNSLHYLLLHEMQFPLLFPLSPALAFQMEKGKKRQLSLPWELGLQRQREGVETASWLGQETPSRLEQRQALG